MPMTPEERLAKKRASRKPLTPEQQEKHRISTLAYYRRNAKEMCAKALPRKRAYHANHRKEDAAKTQAWRQANPEKVKAQKTLRYTINREKTLESDAKYRAKNRNKINERQTKDRQENPEKHREYARTHHKRHPEQRKAGAERHRARKMNAPISDLTAKQWQAIKEHYGYRCVYCGKKPKLLTQDHLTPLSQGGSHTVSNIAPACRSCNSKKNNRNVLKPVQPLLLIA